MAKKGRPERPEPVLDNSGDGPICVPGIGDLPVDFEWDLFDHKRFTHGACEWSQQRITAREVSMLGVMNALTDKANWNKKIFDDEIVEKWRQEALTKPLISERTWTWCLDELRDKARQFEKTGFVHVLDIGCGCVKSDVIVDDNLQKELQNAVRQLFEVAANRKDWHPRSNDQVLNLVHPSLFPLVYGRTEVLTQGGKVSIDKLFEQCGKGDVPRIPSLRSNVRSSRVHPEYEGDHLRDARFSNRFQWLPCEVEFTGQGNRVRITSYINNLHPAHHKELYRIIENLISLSIEPWNEVLIESYKMRKPPRIRTFGATFNPEYPEWGNEYPDAVWPMTRNALGDEKFEEVLQRTTDYLQLPDNQIRRIRPVPPQSDEEEDVEEDERSQDDDEALWDNYDEDERREILEACEDILNGTVNPDFDLSIVIEWKWKRIRKTVIPEPGDSYTYEDWKAGRTDNAVVLSHFQKLFGTSRSNHEYYTIDLADKWRNQGLQVIVKLASIELTPEKPEYAGSNWHLEGMLNEHIVATSIYYYDVENTTESRIMFRHEACLEDMEYPQQEHHPLEEIFGVESLQDSGKIQDLGSIATPQGRLLAFPNTLQHCVQPFRLADPTRPGHRRFVVMWLVDPHYRIVSTRNVPPQQHDWWAAEWGYRGWLGQKLPTELFDMVKEEVGTWPMGMEEAKKLRLELMDERTRLMSLVERNIEEYNFCEH